MKKVLASMLVALSFSSICAAADTTTNTTWNENETSMSRVQRILHPETVTRPAEAATTIAVIPYVNASEEHKGYVDETVTADYTNYFSNAGYTVVPTADITTALDKSGYNSDNEELPEKDQLASIAKDTKADYVVAMMIDELHASRHDSFFQTKVTAKTKLSYVIYSSKSDKVYRFKSTSSDDNKTSFGGVGFKSPIVNVLTRSMEQSNSKLLAFISENNNVEIKQ